VQQVAPTRAAAVASIMYPSCCVLLLLAATVAGDLARSSGYQLLQAAMNGSTPARPWMNASEPPLTRARKLVAAMTLAEQLALLHGSCHEWPRPKGVLGYTGRVCGNRRLGIPELRMNDGPVGFRCSGCEGSTTSWPASINLAAAFNRSLTHEWGAAMGREYYAKGANLQLGPGLSLARLPNNGRLWEYISGEDPFLGFHMGAAVTAGIQSEGVVATAKHFIDNSQETDRGTVAEIVDERTQFEMYLPPFEGAISAGLGAVMCSFNLECIDCGEGINATSNARHSCENHDSLRRDLKGRLGFSGLVMSDWDATHSSSINEGLDMEMPAGKWMNQSRLSEMLAAGNTTTATIAASAERILWGLFQTGLMDRPNLNGSIYHNVSTPQHIHLARRIAATSFVLLQNRGGILPLNIFRKQGGSHTGEADSGDRVASDAPDVSRGREWSGCGCLRPNASG
jgi:beta-glucosidase